MSNEHWKKWPEIDPYCKELERMLKETPQPRSIDAVSDSFDTVKSFARIREKIENIIGEPLNDYATTWRGGEFSLDSHRQNLARLEGYLRSKYRPKTNNIKAEKRGSKGKRQNTIIIKSQQGLFNFSGIRINNIVIVKIVVSLVFLFLSFFFLPKLKSLLGL